MNYYMDIILKPDAEMPANVLLNKVYSKLHKALYQLNSTAIGVSFPTYKVLLGQRLRLHGNQSDLTVLDQLSWLGGLSGYCEVSNLLVVPSNCQYRIISRIQTTMSQSKLNRLLGRGSITQEEAKEYKVKLFTKGLDNPYIELQSESNGHKYRRYINFSDLLAEPVSGDFDSFGLSKTATIPWF